MYNRQAIQKLFSLHTNSEGILSLSLSLMHTHTLSLSYTLSPPLLFSSYPCPKICCVCTVTRLMNLTICAVFFFNNDHAVNAYTSIIFSQLGLHMKVECSEWSWCWVEISQPLHLKVSSSPKSSIPTWQRMEQSVSTHSRGTGSQTMASNTFY